MSPARYIMIGGFLGAGKTTAVAKLAKRLHEQGLRVGLITNDQGSELVDTAMLKSRGFATEEISGGCFCCRFNSLVEAANRLSTGTAPDVFIAEPVGSCTDLVATVSYPLRRIYGERFTVAPLSVLVDPVRALRIFGLEAGGNFSPKVTYIYRKQLEEADLVVINKCDLVVASQQERLRQTLAENFPKAEVFLVSARTEAGLAPWFDRLTASDQIERTAMEVDYDVYAEGEALLGWLNTTVRVEAGEALDGNELIAGIAKRIQRTLNQQNAEVAHLKMTLNPDDGLGDLAVINLVRNDYVPELSQTLFEPVQNAELIINLRAEASPDQLQNAVAAALTHGATERLVQLSIEHLEHFRPGRPQPTHRIVPLAAPGKAGIG